MLLLLRLLGMLLAGMSGWQVGVILAGFPGGEPIAGASLRYVLALTIAGAGLGLLLTPYLTVVPLRWLWQRVHRVAATELLSTVAGLTAGLLLAALAAYPVSLLPDPLGRWLPALLAVVLAWLGGAVGAVRQHDVWPLARGLPAAKRADWGRQGGAGAALLDSSAVIDGRIAEIYRCGFVTAPLEAPRFVLEELQQLADSADPVRRARGRRGLEFLEQLQRDAGLEVVDTDYPELRGVDAKLIRLARRRRAAIVTTDSNLHRVAGLQGVLVLNINDLANALRSVVVPGDALHLAIVQEGRERAQGIGYLDDGTMVVVEGGRRLIGQRVPVEVTRILPTAGGRLLFARLRHPQPLDFPKAEGTLDGDVAPAGAAPEASDRTRLRVVRSGHTD